MFPLYRTVESMLLSVQMESERPWENDPAQGENQGSQVEKKKEKKSKLTAIAVAHRHKRDAKIPVSYKAYY